MTDTTFPYPKQSRAHVWHGADIMKTPGAWHYTLTASEINELESAAQHIIQSGRDIGAITAADFPLARLSNKLKALKADLINGNGFKLISGLPVHTYSRAFAAAVFCGIGAHLGTARSQNAEGHILGHVRDIGKSSTDPNTRIYQTRERQSFHTDSADIVGLLCLNAAKEGGLSMLVSAAAIYNRMRSERPDLLIKLFDPIATDRRGEVPEGAKPYMEIPVFNWHQGFLTVFYQRQYIDSAQRFEGAMRLTDDHIAALDMFDSLANDPDMHIKMELKPGDMQFVYNHNLLHDRTAFVDWPTPEKKRHLLRLWLSPKGDRPLPPVFSQRYGDLTIGNRGGIITKHTQLQAPLL